ncbi:ParB/RepB/Spo0J family partition protein [Microbacterium sp. EYE_5]|uniref:ParB/RepB/Spo0J family partition protein n=1 Tax=unclassified Microbacterium TaxID=2609290 RepID=UPI002005549E|nr:MULTISPECIES: ParB/RepB/Spo0J family partition protein [unclassified Microbacterium]MCK6079583.1 ParB/RepB/Spo0J family partition protein [Microbacterium sp. EYE_382]MCK6084854.1 ParB/RepB/Spo0J family partition protein [Microbacterium sp. EYE_384]MCK6122920.1 ParB/RepB/Spo0J family partition protein [Microbacterium sp. EYE_80]MCK6125617.1 ParB/RepB/Spo0J family partition protein [Microbacterium sp. EYE_79]MCK6140538.1 ParB/RepB/Spo0J family partition protein [Microbacterium sp. EYE_39]
MAKRTGLGRGIGALIPTSSESAEARPVDVFFPGASLTEKNKAKAESNGAGDASEVTVAVDAPPAAPDEAPEREEATPDLVVIPGMRLIEVDPQSIVPNPRQPRSNFDPDDLAELVHSVREFGVLQPVVVRRNDDGDYELIMGERRTRAAREAGLASIPAVLRETEDENLLRDALLENLHRSQLNPLEEASAYAQLLEDFGITQEELATRIGRSRPQISNTIRLLKLPVPVQQRVAAGVLSAGHARAILSVDDPDGMQRLADKIVNEDLSVRAAEAAAKTIGNRVRPLPKAGTRRAHLDDVADRLGDRLNTKVRIALSARKGQISIDFATIQDLNRILGELGETEYGAV